MSGQTFAQWMDDYVAFRKKAAIILSRSLPSEQAQLLYEAQELEPLRWEAESFRAASHAYYYRSKAFKRMDAIAKSRPPSTIETEIKAASHQELWAREDSEGTCRVISSRAFAVAQHLKLIGNP
jgi:hypothetical protein